MGARAEEDVAAAHGVAHGVATHTAHGVATQDTAHGVAAYVAAAYVAARGIEAEPQRRAPVEETLFQYGIAKNYFPLQ